MIRKFDEDSFCCLKIEMKPELKGTTSTRPFIMGAPPPGNESMLFDHFDGFIKETRLVVKMSSIGVFQTLGTSSAFSIQPKTFELSKTRAIVTKLSF